MIGTREFARRNPIMVTPRHLVESHSDREEKSPPSVRGHSDPAISPTESQPRWLCDQGCGAVGDWGEEEPLRPINLYRAPFKKMENIKMAQGRNDLKDREPPTSEAGAIPCDLDDRNSPAAESSEIDRETSNSSRLRLRRRTQ